MSKKIIASIFVFFIFVSTQLMSLERGLSCEKTVKSYCTDRDLENVENSVLTSSLTDQMFIVYDLSSAIYANDNLLRAERLFNLLIDRVVGNTTSENFLNDLSEIFNITPNNQLSLFHRLIGWRQTQFEYIKLGSFTDTRELYVQVTRLVETLSRVLKKQISFDYFWDITLNEIRIAYFLSIDDRAEAEVLLERERTFYIPRLVNNILN